MNEIEAVQMFSALQLERKALQREFEALTEGQQKSRAGSFRVRRDLIELGLKIATASKSDRLDDEIQKLKERLKKIEKPYLQAVI